MKTLTRNLLLRSRLSAITTTIVLATSWNVFAEEKIHEGYSETAPLYKVDGFVISNHNIEAYLWNPRGKTEEQVAERAQFISDAYEVKRTPEQQKRAAEARKKYSSSIAIDSLFAGAVGIIGTTEEDFKAGIVRSRDGGLAAVSATVWAFPGDGDKINVLGRIDASMKVVEELGMVNAKSVDDIRKAKKDGKMAVIWNVQGADFVIDDMSMLTKAASKGLRLANFTYNNDNALAGGGANQKSGVSALGRKFVESANANGIVVDCSHASNATCIDAASYSTKPTIASHSNVAALFKMNRNVSDEAILAIGKTGGVVCNTGVGLFLNEKGVASPEEYAKHVVYTAKLLGRDRTCFATDYMPSAKAMFAANVSNVDVYPPEKGFGAPASNMAAEHIWDVVGILEDEYKWSEKDIRGYLGENLLRVYAANWK
jgi:membrane dipeptidase